MSPHLHRMLFISRRASLFAIMLVLYATSFVIAQSPVPVPAWSTNASSSSAIVKQRADSTRVLQMRDTSALRVNTPDSALWKSALSKGDYDFDRHKKAKGSSLWDLLNYWLSRQSIRGPRVNHSSFWDYLIYLIIGAMIVLLVLWLSKGGFRLALRRAAPELVSDQFEELMVSAPDDLRARKREAEAQEDYRRALRYAFLSELRELVDARVLEVDIAKTNRQYARELKVQSLRDAFLRAAYHYELAWYGEHLVTRSDYELMSKDFDELQRLRVAQAHKEKEAVRL